MANKADNEPKPAKKTKIIIVNGREKEVNTYKISYEELVKLAFGEMIDDPNVVYTVTYSKDKKRSGSMVQGDSVVIKQGMIINVTRTDRS